MRSSIFFKFSSSFFRINRLALHCPRHIPFKMISQHSYGCHSHSSCKHGVLFSDAQQQAVITCRPEKRRTGIDMFPQYGRRQPGKNIPQHPASDSCQHSEKQDELMALSITRLNGHINSQHCKQPQSDRIRKIQDPLKHPLRKIRNHMLIPVNGKKGIKGCQQSHRNHHGAYKHGRRHDSKRHIPHKSAS